MLKDELNQQQYEAVKAPIDIPILVLAGAGSGKTRTLTYRVAHLVMEYDLRASQLLLLTFTNKASRQMLGRVEELTNIESWKFWGGTFHSIANKFLRIHSQKVGLSSNFSILDDSDSDKFIKTLIEENFPSFLKNKDNPRAKLVKEIISYRANTCKSMQKALYDRFSWIESSVEDLEAIELLYAKNKIENNVCDFDDLLILWHKLLSENSDILKIYNEKFENILVDEYQDTNLLQSSILDLLANRGQISAVGDDSQSIYSWRGANIENILKFKERYTNANIYKIEQNYRSSPEILAFANGILANTHTSQEFKKELVGVRKPKSLPLVMKCMDSIAQGRQVADCINDLIDSGKYTYSDIAVLYRAHSQAMDLQMQMQYKMIPFVMTSGLKFFELAHVKDIIAQVKFVSNQKDKTSFMRFVRFIPKIGEKTANKLWDIAQKLAIKTNISFVKALSDKSVIAKAPTQAKELFELMAQELLVLDKMINVKKAPLEEQGDLFTENPDENNEQASAKEIIKYVCSGWYVVVMKSLYEDWQDRFADFDSLYEYSMRFKDYDDFLANVSLEMETLDATKSDEVQRVRLMTVHQSKGLEFRVVFVISAAEGLFPNQRCIDDGDIEEERRLFYVATTRAMDHLIFSYPKVAMLNGEFQMRDVSRFIEEQSSFLYTKGL